MVAPSGEVQPDRLQRGINCLEELGFRVTPPTLWPGGYRSFSAPVEVRLGDLKRAFADPEVCAVWCARGGYGVAHLLPQLDASEIRAAGKLCIGFSDIAALLGFLVRACGLAAIHGPMVAHDASRELTLQRMGEVIALASGSASWSIEVPVGLRVGEVVAPLVGGCLTVLTSLVGTPYLPSFQGAIALFEDVHERPIRRIDRMLTQLRQSGALDGVRGFLFGNMIDCGPQELLAETVDACLGDLGVPIGFGAAIGHGEENHPVPLGVPVRLRVDQASTVPGRPPGGCAGSAGRLSAVGPAVLES